MNVHPKAFPDASTNDAHSFSYDRGWCDGATFFGSIAIGHPGGAVSLVIKKLLVGPDSTRALRFFSFVLGTIAGAMCSPLDPITGAVAGAAAHYITSPQAKPREAVDHATKVAIDGALLRGTKTSRYSSDPLFFAAPKKNLEQ